MLASFTTRTLARSLRTCSSITYTQTARLVGTSSAFNAAKFTTQTGSGLLNGANTGASLISTTGRSQGYFF